MNKTLYEEMQDKYGGLTTPLPAPTKAEEVSVQTLDALIKDMFALAREIEGAEEIVTKMRANLTILKSKATQYLKTLNRKDFKTPYGSISIRAKWSVNMPPNEEAKLAFFEYLKEKGLFEKYATVHYQSLNSYYMAEWEEAKAKGEGIGFSIPGVGEPKLFEDLGLTKPRGKKETGE